MKRLCGAIAVLIAGIAIATIPVRAITDGGGGTCFGDSGGPNFVGTSNVVGAVTSFGSNGNCAGTGGVDRVDRQDDLDFLATFGVTP